MTRRLLASAVAVLAGLAGFTLWLLDPWGGVPMGTECRAVVRQDGPDLEAKAAELLRRDDAGLKASADCDSGGYPAVEAQVEDPAAIIRRMESLGTAQERRNNECLEYLQPSECNRTWVFTPEGSEKSYGVLLPSGPEGVFAIGVWRS